MTQMRKGIAAQMTRALAVPHAYVQMEIDATRLVALREKTKKAYQAKEGLSLSYVPFVVKAAAEALKRNPTFNAHWTDQGLLAKRRINIGVAVAVDEGLIVPVIRDADQLSVHGLNAAIADVAGRAKANKLRVDDFGGGTFTVDNTGYLGTNLVMPIINVPEVGIVDDGGDHQARGRGLDRRRRRDRDPPDHEHGPGRRPPGQRRRRRRRAAARHQGLARGRRSRHRRLLGMRALALSVALAAGLVAGCSLLPHPPPPAVAPTVTEIPDALGATYIVKPWPHNAIVAFLCLRDPGDSFTIMHPKPDPDAGCAALSTRKDGETSDLHVQDD